MSITIQALCQIVKETLQSMLSDIAREDCKVHALLLQELKGIISTT